MSLPFRAGEPLPAATYEQVKTRAVFDCFKWDPQVEDVNVLADYPIILDGAAWLKIAALAEKLAAETLALEAELRRKPALHNELGLPRSIRWHLRRGASMTESTPNARLIRFDFHYTTDGWRISEANADVPGGFIEASGFTRLMAEHYPGFIMAGDVADVLAKALRRTAPENGMVALVHATAYTDDRQMMLFLARYLENAGLKTALISPSHLRWREGRAFIETDWLQTEADYIFRFFPGEWLPNLPRAAQWGEFFVPSHVPCCNPAYALLSQSKRLPLIWDKLETLAPTWREYLPETCDPRAVKWSDEWVYKPAFGRIGEDIAMNGVTTPKDLQTIQKQVRKHPGDWIAQRHFQMIPLETAHGLRYPCFGVYTVNGQAVGIYGRIGEKPLITSIAPDIAVLIDSSGGLF